MAKKIEGIEEKQIEKAVVTAEKENVKNGVRIKIPLDPLNPKDKGVSVTINGKNTIYKRGESYIVDQTTCDVLENAQII